MKRAQPVRSLTTQDSRELRRKHAVELIRERLMQGSLAVRKITAAMSDEDLAFIYLKD